MRTFALPPFLSVRMMFLPCTVAHNFPPLKVFNAVRVGLALVAAVHGERSR
jgi:hypothetical protein